LDLSGIGVCVVVSVMTVFCSEWPAIGQADAVTADAAKNIDVKIEATIIRIAHTP